MPENQEQNKQTESFVPRHTKEGLSSTSAVAAFLGSIFFAALLILFQSPEMFTQNLLEIKVTESLSININQRMIIALPLTITIVLFIFSAFFISIACNRSKMEDCDRLADVAITPFLLGFLSFFASLFVVLALINILVAFVAISLSVILLFWWEKTIKRELANVGA